MIWSGRRDFGDFTAGGGLVTSAILTGGSANDDEGLILLWGGHSSAVYQALTPDGEVLFEYRTNPDAAVIVDTRDRHAVARAGYDPAVTLLGAFVQFFGACASELSGEEPDVLAPRRVRRNIQMREDGWPSSARLRGVSFTWNYLLVEVPADTPSPVEVGGYVVESYERLSSGLDASSLPREVAGRPLDAITAFRTSSMSGPHITARWRDAEQEVQVRFGDEEAIAEAEFEDPRTDMVELGDLTGVVTVSHPTLLDQAVSDLRSIESFEWSVWTESALTMRLTETREEWHQHIDELLRGVEPLRG